MSNTILFSAVGFAVFIIALLFCHAYDITNAYIYYPLAILIGYNISMRGINFFMPTAFDPPPPPVPTTRQGKKKAAKEAELAAKRQEKFTRMQADADRKAAEAREFD
ncbi:hypothetical protein BGZ83_007419 [Gryganskiella cystojenkinii]|nr:hypothetical protein BGZ83_007419 [Gryganskiella cystojenkinii]